MSNHQKEKVKDKPEKTSGGLENPGKRKLILLAEDEDLGRDKGKGRFTGIGKWFRRKPTQEDA